MVTALIIVGVIIVLLAIILAVNYNGFVRIRNQADEAFATMDVYLKKRFDLIPNLVETVKGYASHESTTLENVIRARNMAVYSRNLNERQQSENMLSGTLKSLFAVSENYPELKADRGFQNLQIQLQQIEGDIAQSRKYYNAVVKVYNTRTEIFPISLVAALLGFNKYPFFMADNYERKNVDVYF